MVMANKLTEKIGSFYNLVKDIGTTTRDKTSLLDTILGLNLWFTSRYERDDLSVEIREWHGGLAIPTYLDRIRIFFKGELAYDANVHVRLASWQDVHVSSPDPKWQKAVDGILSEYL